MDTSETYIKMCERAPKIQELLSRNEGYLHSREERRDGLIEPYPYLAVYDGRPTCPKCDVWRDAKFCPECGTKVEKFVGKPDIAFGGACERNLKEDKVIWLPRQDQLQEIYLNDMPDGTYRKIATLAEEFHDYHETHGYPSYAGSMEQLWLAFVMKEKYNKTWNGESWITVV